MPEEGVRASLERLRARLGAKAHPLTWAVWLSISFGVSEEAAAYRMINLDLPEAFDEAIVDAVKDETPNSETSQRPEDIAVFLIRNNDRIQEVLDQRWNLCLWNTD